MKKIFLHLENRPMLFKALPECLAVNSGRRNLLKTWGCDVNDADEMSETCSA